MRHISADHERQRDRREPAAIAKALEERRKGPSCPRRRVVEPDHPRDSPRLRSLVPPCTGWGIYRYFRRASVLPGAGIARGSSARTVHFRPYPGISRGVPVARRARVCAAAGEPGRQMGHRCHTRPWSGRYWQLNVLQADRPGRHPPVKNLTRRQLSWADDAFGIMHHNRPTADSWNRTSQSIRAMVHKGSKVILTEPRLHLECSENAT